MLPFQVDMIDKLLIPHFSHIDADPDVEVRKMVVEIVIGMAQGCSRDEFFDLISIIEKVWMVQAHDSCLCCRESFGNVCVCVCVCVCITVFVYVCVCVCVSRRARQEKI